MVMEWCGRWKQTENEGHVMAGESDRDGCRDVICNAGVRSCCIYSIARSRSAMVLGMAVYYRILIDTGWASEYLPLLGLGFACNL